MKSDFFAFEADFVQSLRCIPMQVRMKLDTCGIKLKLTDWHQLSQEERQNLVSTPCLTEPEIAAYRQLLQEYIAHKTQEPLKEMAVDPHPSWLNLTTIPEEVLEKAQSYGLSLSECQWQNLTPLQRFALIKLSRSGHENKNFLPALQEFNLI